MEPRNTYPDKWLMPVLGAILTVSPILRFSWDSQTQILLGAVIILYFLYIANNYKLSFNYKKDGLFILFFIITLLPYRKAAEFSVYRNEVVFVLACLVFSYMIGHLPIDKIKTLLKIPIFVGIWFSVLILTYFVMNPVKYVLGTVIPSEIIVNLNILAGYLTMCFALSLIYWNDENKNFRILIFLIPVAIILSKSRVAIAGSCIVFGMYIYYFHKPVFRFFRYFVYIILTILALLTILKLRLYQMSDNLYLSDRIIWWNTALSIFSDNYLTGSGWSSFGTIYLNYRTLPGLNTVYAHNLPLQLLAETGLAGLSVFVLILVKTFAGARTLFEGKDKDVFLPVFSGLIAFLFINLFDYSFYIHSLFMLFWGCLGVIYFDKGVIVKREKKLLPQSIYIITLIFAAVILLKPFAGYIFYLDGIKKFKEQKYEQAEGRLVMAVALDQKASVYYNELAKTSYFEYKKNNNKIYLENAVATEKHAIEHFRNNAVYWSDLAWLFRENGQNRQALQAGLNAVKYDRFNPNYQKGLRLISNENVR